MTDTMNYDEENCEYEFGTGSVFQILDDMAALREEREKAEKYSDVYIEETYSSPEKHNKVCKETISDKPKKIKSKYKSSEEYKRANGIDFAEKKQEFIQKRKPAEKFGSKDNKEKKIQKTFVSQKKQIYKQPAVIKNKDKKKQSTAASLFKLFWKIYAFCICMGLIKAFLEIFLGDIFDLIGDFFS